MPEVRRRGTGGTQGRLESAILGPVGEGGGLVEHVMRGLFGAGDGTQTGTSVVSAGGVTTYDTSGEGTISLEDLPTGVYLVRASSRLVFGTDSTDLYHRVDIDGLYGPLGGPAAPAGYDMVAVNLAPVTITEDPGAITATPTILNGPGVASLQDTTLTATRFAST